MMRILEKILCPVDFSESSTRALQWSEYLAKKFGSEVIVLHVTQYYPSLEFMNVDYDAYTESTTKAMREFLAPLQIKHEAMLSTGDPAAKIVALSEGLGATVIVMGTHGLKGAAHKWVGSTTENVVRTSTVPVFTVSPECKPFEMPERKRALIPVSRLDRPPLGYSKLRKILRQFQTSPSMLHVIEHGSPESIAYGTNQLTVSATDVEQKQLQLRRLGATLISGDMEVEATIDFGDIAQSILRETEFGKYDFALLAARKRTFLPHFVETIAYQVISRSRIPVITVRI